MVPCPVRTGRCVDMVHALEDLKRVLHIFEREHGLAEFELSFVSFWPPAGLDGAVGEIDDPEPQRCSGRSSGQTKSRIGFGSEGFPREESLQSRQRNASTQAA